MRTRRTVQAAAAVSFGVFCLAHPALAVSLKKACKSACAGEIAACVESRDSRRACKRNTRRHCRRNGLAVCLNPGEPFELRGNGWTLNTPSAVRATAISADAVAVSWGDGSTGEDGYSIERSLAPTGGFEVIATTGPNLTTYRDTQLIGATTHYYRVRVFLKRKKRKLFSGYSRVVHAAPLGDDRIAPTVSIPSPASGTSYTSAQTVTITASASDNVGVTRVEFHDGAVLEHSDTTAPYTHSWPITAADNGRHRWTATAYDAAGYSTTSSMVSLTVGIGGATGEPGLVGFLPGIGTPMGLSVSGTEAFVASDTFGLSVVDVLNPSAPEVLGAADRPFVGHTSAVRGTRAVVMGENAAGTAHLWMLDVSDVTMPRVVGELPSTVTAVHVSEIVLDGTGTRAVAAMGQAGIWVIDLADPTAPRVQGTYDTGGWAYGVALNGDASLAYVADGPGDLVILDLSNPSLPTLVATKPMTGIARDVAVADGVAYIADQQGSLKIYDVSTPSAPRQIGVVGLSATARHVTVEGTRLAVLASAAADFLRIYDISTPAQPQLQGWVVVGEPSTAQDVVLLDGRAYVGIDTEGLKIYDLAPATPALEGVVDDTFVGRAIDAAGELAVAVVMGEHLPTGTALLKVLDIADGTMPVVVGELSTTLAAVHVSEIVLDGTGARAVAAMGQAGIWVVDLADPAAPRIQGTYDTPGWAYGVALDSAAPLAYVADGTGDLVILDLSNPSLPTLVATKSMTGIARDVAVADAVAYIADQQGSLKIYDVSMPSAPRQIGIVGLSAIPRHVAVEGTRLAVLASAAADFLQIYDISTPAQPQLQGWEVAGEPSAAQDVALLDGHAYVAVDTEGLKTYDVTTSTDPALLHVIATVGAANDVTVGATPSLACVADAAAGVSVVDLGTP